MMPEPEVRAMLADAIASHSLHIRLNYSQPDPGLAAAVDVLRLQALTYRLELVEVAEDMHADSLQPPQLDLLKQ